MNRRSRLAKLETVAGKDAELAKEDAAGTAALAWLIDTAGSQHLGIAARIKAAQDAGDKQAMVVAIVDLAQASELTAEFFERWKAPKEESNP